MINAAKVSAADGRAGASRSGASARRAAIFAAIVISSLGAATLSGCSSSPAALAPVAAARLQGAAAQAGTPAPPATPAPAAPPGAPGPVSPASGSLRATIAGLGPAAALVPGGAAVPFTVTLSNTSTQSYPSIEPLVWMSPCGCTSSGRFPAGTLQVRSADGGWQTIAYDAEDSGAGFLDVNQQPGIQLQPGATVSVDYRIALKWATSAQVQRPVKPSTIDVTLVALPSHAQIGSSPAASGSVQIFSGLAQSGSSPSGSLSATITYVRSAPDLTPGGPPMLFTVVVSNTTTQTYSDIEPLVAIGHCSCTSSSMFPEGTLKERSEGGSWRNVDYDTMGFATDFLYVNQHPGIDLPPGATVSFECRLAIGPNSGQSITRGSSSIAALLEVLPAHTEIYSAVANQAQIEVLPAKPA